MAKVAGLDDVLVGNQVLGEGKVRALARLARECRLTVAVNDLRNVGELSRAAAAAGSLLELLVEVNVGMGRAGVRTAGRRSRSWRRSPAPGGALPGTAGLRGPLHGR